MSVTPELLASVREDIANAKANGFHFFTGKGFEGGDWADTAIADDLTDCTDNYDALVREEQGYIDLVAAVAAVRAEFNGEGT